MGPLKRGWEFIRLPLVLLLLLATTWLGLKEGYDGYVGSETTGQRVGSISQLVYGASAVAALVGIYLRAPWLRYALLCWGVALSVTGGLSPVVWGGAPWTAGLVSGGATALTAAGVGWAATRKRKE